MRWQLRHDYIYKRLVVCVKTEKSSPVLFLTVLLVVMGTGTAVTILFTCETDLFFAEAMLLTTRGKLGRGVDTRRVFTFPSGFLRDSDLKLFVSCLSLGLDLRGLLFVGGREDAKGHGYAGFKVQVGDLNGARILFPSTFRSK